MKGFNWIAKKLFARFLQTREKFGIIRLPGIYAIVTNYAYKNLDYPEALNLIESVRNDKAVLQSNMELYHLYTLAKKTDKLPGEIAEVGVYKGGSAKIIREASQKHLHLFDTYEGVPAPAENDVPDQAAEGDCCASLEEVQNYLKEYDNLSYHKGLFPLTGEAVKDQRFSFVHLDVDLYKSTRESLEFFYPRMTKGGVIICHDYGKIDGARIAFDEFFKDKPEIINKPIETIQCFIIKV